MGLTESAVIIAGNLISIILFKEDSYLRKRSLYLVMNLIVAEFSLLKLFFILGDSMTANFRNLPWIHSGVRFPPTSLTHIAMISSPQAHTKFRPFKHRVIKRWVYGVAIAVVWVLAAVVSASLVLRENEIT